MKEHTLLWLHLLLEHEKDSVQNYIADYQCPEMKRYKEESKMKLDKAKAKVKNLTACIKWVMKQPGEAPTK